jgi:hypothetical protein
MAPLSLALALAFFTAPPAPTAPFSHSLAFHSVGPGGGGWIEAVTCDPRNPDVVYVGCDVGGFYISFDGGHHFETRNTGLRDFFVEQIAVSPRDSRILLLATEGGIYRTTNQGLTWHWIRAGFPDVQRYAFPAPISAICFDFSHPDVAYAGIGPQRWDKSGQGLIYRLSSRSELHDAGLTWRPVSAGQLPADVIVRHLEVKPDDSRTILAATSRGLFRSDNSGRTWHASSDGLPHTWGEELAFAPSAPNIVYLTLRTTARDASWRSITGDLPPDAAQNPRGLLLDAADSRHLIFAAGGSVAKSAGIYETRDSGNRLGLWGGISTDGLVRWTPEQMKADVARTVEACKPGGGFILGASHSVTVRARADNYLAAIEALNQHGWRD